MTNKSNTSASSRPTIPDPNAGDDNDGTSAPAPNTALQTALAGLMNSRLGSLIGRSSGYIESLPVDVKRSVEALKGVQVKQTALQNQYKRECLELEKKYLELQKPLYERRSAIVTGASPPTAEEVQAGEAESTAEDPEYTPLPKADGAAPAAIPEFWLTALRNHVGIADLITERDAGALRHLIDIRLTYLPPTDAKPGFKLVFVFSPNEYFENEVLEKTYVYQPEVGYAGDFVYDRAIGCDIKWKADKDLTKDFEVKKQRNKNTNRVRLVRKAHPTDSFFNFFSPPVMPSEEAVEGGDVEDEELEDIEERLEVDYQIGEDIKERIIPRAVDYFTGKALEFEEIDDDDDDDAFDDNDEDDDESDSEYESEPPAKRRGPPKGRRAGADAAVGAAAQDVNAEECRQQ